MGRETVIMGQMDWPEWEIATYEPDQVSGTHQVVGGIMLEELERCGLLGSTEEMPGDYLGIFLPFDITCESGTVKNTRFEPISQN